MTALWQIIRKIWVREWWSLLRGTLLSLAVLLAGAALLGLSGWFITAAGIAGMAGLGIAFDVFKPSAGVRFLALSRAIGRYGERMLTHDATLRSLATLRVDIFKNILRQPFQQSAKIRASSQLTRLTLDVDALDGVALRLIIPILASGATLAAVTIFLWLVVSAYVSLIILAGLIPLTCIAFWLILKKAGPPTREAHLADNALRTKSLDLLQGRTELIMSGQLTHQITETLKADATARKALKKADQVERTGGLIVESAEAITGSALLLLCVTLVQGGLIEVAMGALAFYAFLGLGETILPLRRGIAELAKIREAAKRIWPYLQTAQTDALLPSEPPTKPDAASEIALQFLGVTYAHPGAQKAIVTNFDLSLNRGEIISLTGASGSGKSTLLGLAANLMAPQSGTILLEGDTLNDLMEPTLRQKVGLLSQRSTLLSGTVRENLTLGLTNIQDTDLWEVLKAVQLEAVIKERGGLESRLGESGQGLSGGEGRRLALARILLRQPKVLLLDEPTEGLDRETADAVLQGIRAYLPSATIVIASHREAEKKIADRIIEIQG